MKPLTLLAIMLMLAGLVMADGQEVLAMPLCNGLVPTIVGTAGNDILVGTAGNDVIHGRGGNDTIRGRGGHDHICGGRGDDILRGGAGDDALFGGNGNDEIRGGRDDDLLIGGAGTDLCLGGPDTDELGLRAGGATCESVGSIEGPLTITSVSPAITDPTIDDPVGGDHLIYVNAAIPPRDEILVHFPGTFGTPAGNAVFLQAVANQGMRAIGLQYVNDSPINSACVAHWRNNPSADPDCQENLRLERIYGVDASPLDDVSPANSLVNRLTKLLEYLDAQQPELAWGDYLDAGAPRWDRIVVSGHSQGSGMAALIARDKAVARVLMFGGPSDFDPLGNSAAWMTAPKTTLIGNHYGFRHQNDPRFPRHAELGRHGATRPPHHRRRQQPAIRWEPFPRNQHCCPRG